MRKDPTFQRALDILLLFVERPTMTVHALSKSLGMRKSTAYRFVSGLRARGFLEDVGLGQYRLGRRILQLAEAARETHSVVDLSVPVMERLAQVTGETCLLTTVVADRALAVRQVAAPQPVRLTFQPGVMRPLHAGASSKVLFASSTKSTGSVCSGPAGSSDERRAASRTRVGCVDSSRRFARRATR